MTERNFEMLKSNTLFAIDEAENNVRALSYDEIGERTDEDIKEKFLEAIQPVKTELDGLL